MNIDWKQQSSKKGAIELAGGVIGATVIPIAVYMVTGNNVDPEGMQSIQHNVDTLLAGIATLAAVVPSLVQAATGIFNLFRDETKE